MERCTVEDLDKIKLEQYPDVFLVNVPLLKNADTIKKLQDYVSRGGSIAWFLGDKIVPDFYNNVLFKEYENASREHLFPVLIDPQLPEPMSEEEKLDRLQNDKQPKILFPDLSNPIIRGHPVGLDDKGGLAKNQDTLRYLIIDRYYKCLPQSQWDPEPKQAQRVVVLPNRNSIDQYKRAAQDYIKRIVDQVRDLASDDEKLEPYKARVERSRKRIIEALGTPYLDNLIRAFDDLLLDPGVKDDPNRPNMVELWAQPKDEGAQERHRRLPDDREVRRPAGGDAAVRQGPGAGVPDQRRHCASKWNEWASGLALWTYPVFIKQMQQYLISVSDTRNRIVGTDLALPELEADRYKPEMRITRKWQPDPFAKPVGDKPVEWPETVALPVQPLTPTSDGLYKPKLPKVDKPGVYTFEFFPDADPGGKAPTEVQAYAFNIDSAAESDLNRAPKEALLRKTAVGAGVAGGGKVALRSPGDSFDDFKDPPPDLSNMIVLFLLIALVFAVEQALAVHLSFHLKESEGAVMAAPAARRSAAA